MIETNTDAIVKRLDAIITLLIQELQLKESIAE